jgi:hypothetical protein
MTPSLLILAALNWSQVFDNANGILPTCDEAIVQERAALQAFVDNPSSETAAMAENAAVVTRAACTSGMPTH